ncbi:MAG: polysaccharide biosynthesis tyrosine autokinase [Syntrophobacteraceae bacterium]
MQNESERLNLTYLPAVVSKDNFQPPSRYVNEPIPEFDDSADIRDYLEIIRRRKWLILTILLISIATTLVVSLAVKPQYKANGKIELTIQSPRVTKFEDMTMLGTQLQTREFMQTQLKLLKSETLSGRVIDKLQLEHNPALTPALDHSLAITNLISSAKNGVADFFAGLFHSNGAMQADDPKLPELRLRKKVEDKFAKNLEAQPERDTTIFSLAFTSTDPSLSRDVINTLIQEYITWQVDKKIDATIAAKQRLEKQIELARIQLEKAETNLNDFARKAGIVSLNANQNLIYSQLEEANRAYSAIQTERMNKEALYDQAKQGGNSLPAMLESPLIQKLRENYVTAAADYKESSATFKDDYPKLQNLKAKMQDIDKQIKTEENRIQESIKNDYLAATMKEEALKKDTEEKKVLAIALNDQSTQYKILDREVETSKQIHQSLLERSKEIDAKVGTELGNIQVVDYARLPLKPSSPNIPLNILLAAVAGMVLGLGLAFLLEYLDNTIKRIEELSDRFRLAVLGVVPVVDAGEAVKIRSLVRLNPTAGFSESIRTAKVSIQLSSSLDRPPKMLFITSTNAGEGKSTIALNLAQAFASDEKVLIIDADLRKPNLHRGMGKNGNGSSTGKKTGLSNYLTGTGANVVQESGLPNLKVVYAGPIPPNPSELLSSNRMRQFLAEVYEDYDRIIIDGPPAMGFADALILGHYADGVILVSVLGETHREALRVFRRTLENVGGRMIGTIVNKLNQGSPYGGYYKYYRYYSYQTAYRQPKPSNMLSSGERLDRVEGLGDQHPN